jgi:hypothetical protein
VETGCRGGQGSPRAVVPSSRHFCVTGGFSRRAQLHEVRVVYVSSEMILIMKWKEGVMVL